MDVGNQEWRLSDGIESREESRRLGSCSPTLRLEKGELQATYFAASFASCSCSAASSLVAFAASRSDFAAASQCSNVRIWLFPPALASTCHDWVQPIVFGKFFVLAGLCIESICLKLEVAC
jgi:hypothetical protein